MSSSDGASSFPIVDLVAITFSLGSFLLYHVYLVIVVYANLGDTVRAQMAMAYHMFAIKHSTNFDAPSATLAVQVLILSVSKFLSFFILLMSFKIICHRQCAMLHWLLYLLAELRSLVPWVCCLVQAPRHHWRQHTALAFWRRF